MPSARIAADSAGSVLGVVGLGVMPTPNTPSCTGVEVPLPLGRLTLNAVLAVLLAKQSLIFWVVPSAAL